ncbi:unnamed protein product [Blepharisma stoltei]|uniref:Uncharacterized protein n=1 Tax=Blepharisma stoltei TaxID=1481888 RepID=A0AAU9J2B7_9CILI|nr:unnamed protein product [Blepharisma stoltei]
MSFSPNKNLQTIWDIENPKVASERLTRNRSNLDLHNRQKRLNDERLTKIENENIILLNKLSDIQRGKRSSSLPKLRPEPNKPSNWGQRKNRLVQITIENYALLKRLQQAKSIFDYSKQKTERHEQEKLARSICEYPYILGPGDHMRKISGFNTSKYDVEIPKYRSPNDGSTFYSGQIVLDNKPYIIDIRADNKIMRLDAYKPGDIFKHTLEISLNDAVFLMKGKNNYEFLISMLSLENGELVLTEP